MNHPAVQQTSIREGIEGSRSSSPDSDLSIGSRLIRAKNKRDLVIPGCLAVVLFAGSLLTSAADDARELIHWLLDSERDLQSVPFREVVQATSGKTVIPVKADDARDQALLRKIGLALDTVLARLNDPAHPAHRQARINEVSAHFETAIREALNLQPGFRCAVPRTADGRAQRSGYPDLRLEDTDTGRVIYLDPKLYAKDSRDSSLRTFYFEPKRETNKVLDDAHHLLVGVEHGGREGRAWKFTRWEIVDLARFNVRLKAEFQASNRDIYQPSAIVGQSKPAE